MNNLNFQPKVSIIIPVYNGSNYMREAIDSALAQTYKNIEIIVINDGSKDDGKTLDIAKSYGNQIILIDKKNGGVATALNAGIAKVTGDYFSWLSHDDVYPNDKIEKQISFLSNQTNKNVIVFGDYVTIDENGKFIKFVSTRGVDTNAMLFELYSSQIIHGCSLLIPKSAFNVCGVFKENLPTTQDYDLWLRMCEQFPFVYNEGVYVHSRQHGEQGSRSTKHKKEVLDFYIKNLNQLNADYFSSKFSANEIKDKYLLLLKKFSSYNFFPVYISVFKQAKNQLDLTDFKFILLNSFIFLFLLFARSLKELIKKMLPLSLKNILKRNLNKPSRLNDNTPNTLDFIKIYKKNIFGSKESRSGSGSTMAQTEYIRSILSNFFNEIEVKSVLDVPCGDFNWMNHVNLQGVKYIGGDIVPDLIENNNRNFKTDERDFKLLNIITDSLPKSDLIFCRDCLVHLKFEDGIKAIQNFKKSGSKYLLTTTFVQRNENEELYGVWRVLNLQKSPYNLPDPIKIINEKCTEVGGLYKDKSLGLWFLEDIRL